MAGTFDLSGPGIAAAMAAPATPVAVYYYDPESEESPYLLPNVVPVRIDYREGPEPPVARFRYLFDDAYAVNLGWPSRIEDIFPIDAQGDYIAGQDDRLVVVALNPDGSRGYLFDGFAQVPQADLDGSGERGSFTAVGVACTAWYDHLHTRVERDASKPDDTSGNSDREIHASCRFNPADQGPGNLGGVLPNSTANAYYTVDEEDGNYPVFLDPLLLERQATQDATWLDYWFVSDVAAYLLKVPSPADDYVTWPTLDSVGQLLRTLAPPPGTTVFDPATAAPADCIIRDYDATGKCIPEVLGDVLGYAGFLLTWDLGADADGDPETFLRFYRRDGAASGTPKAVYLDAPGSSLVEGSINNVASLNLARDVNHIVNAWRVETEPRQVEVTVYLAPLFRPAAADATPANRVKFAEANLVGQPATVRRKYRWYGADECGDGHWDALNSAMSDAVIDLSPAFPPAADGSPSYAVRYRPGTRTLIAQDSAGRPLKAVLEAYVSDNTYSSDPYLRIDQTFTTGWQVVNRGWKLLHDRLGIEITEDDPEMWATGNKALPKIAAISQCALAGQSGWQPFSLRLTTTLHADRRIKAESPRRPASPTQFARWRSADAHDHFRHCSVSTGSINYPGLGGDGKTPVVVRDDTKKAKAHGDQLRSAHEMPPLAGSVRIPGITRYYGVGDRIGLIRGRGISLRTNVGAAQGEAATYPWVVGVSWEFEGDQQYTVLQLSDRRGETTSNSW